MPSLPHCPKCNSEYTYKDNELIICPECAYEWDPNQIIDSTENQVVKDAHGNILQNGDTISILKDLHVKNSSLIVKVGTKAKNIRLIEGDHNIDCKIDGIGAMQLKSQFVKKV